LGLGRRERPISGAGGKLDYVPKIVDRIK